jgi:hypothetical protein
MINFAKFYKRFLERVRRFLRIYILRFKKLLYCGHNDPEVFGILFIANGYQKTQNPLK